MGLLLLRVQGTPGRAEVGMAAAFLKEQGPTGDPQAGLGVRGPFGAWALGVSVGVPVQVWAWGEGVSQQGWPWGCPSLPWECTDADPLILGLWSHGTVP